MSDGTKIEWTDATVNAVNGCSVISPGCKLCYAMKQAHRFDARRGLTRMTAGGMVWTGEVRFNETQLLQPLAWKRARRIFWNAHGDLFRESVPDAWIDKVFAVCALTPQHSHQILTKRSARMRAYLSARKATPPIMVPIGDGTLGQHPFNNELKAPPNIWLGVSVEDQQRADERIPDLLATPAAVRFISAEPLLGPIDLEIAWKGESALEGECWGDCAWCANGHPPMHNCAANLQSEAVWVKGRSGLDWVIVGGESGPGARSMHPDWARSLRDQCAAAGVPMLFKQWGEWREWDDGAGNPEPEEVENDTEYADAVYASAIRPAFVSLDGRVFRRDQLPEELPCRLVERVGKKAAGRLLDGVQHDGMPA